MTVDKLFLKSVWEKRKYRDENGHALGGGSDRQPTGFI